MPGERLPPPYSDIDVMRVQFDAQTQPLVSVIECFETDGGVNYRSDRLIMF